MLFLSRFILIAILCAGSTFVSHRLLACASCGSGGDDPLILYPNENLKLYLGALRTTRFKNILADGQEADPGGPEVKDTYRVAIGKSIGLRSFVTLSLAHIINRLGSEQRSGFSDPSLAGRYTIVQQRFDAPMIPQVQFILGYKPTTARSIRSSQDRRLLDVFGTGFSEYKAGIDVWYGMYAVKCGVAYVYAWNEPKFYQGRKYKPGDSQRYTATLGYEWNSLFKTSVGGTREERSSLRENGNWVNDSNQRSHGAFLNQDVQMSPLALWRFSFARQGHYAINKNTGAFDAYGVAYMRSF